MNDIQFCFDLDDECPREISDAPTFHGVEDSEALYMTLHSQPCTDAAKRMVEALAYTVLEEAGLSNKPSQKLRFAIGAIVADLFKSHAFDPPGACKRHTSPNSFSGRPVGYRPFVRALRLMKQTGFIDVTDGIWFRRTANGEGRLTIIRPMAKLLRFALARGVTPARCEDHFFRLARPKSIPDPVKLSRVRMTVKGVKGPKSVMAIGATDHLGLLHEMKINHFNEYFAKQSITPDCHFAFQRHFHDGDADGFCWDSGGRIYSIGSDSYQQMKSDERAKILINGEPVVEIDIGSSHIRILYGLHGCPIDPAVDPYDITGIPREIVKDFVTMTLGHTGFQRAWSPRKKEEYAERGIDLQKAYPIANVRKAVLDHLPLLQGWDTSSIRWQQLQFIESQVIAQSMALLAFEGDIPALPVHDSIIVPAKHQQLAIEVLRYCFQNCVGAVPMLKVKESWGSA